jgi:hypothetical protein
MREWKLADFLKRLNFQGDVCRETSVEDEYPDVGNEVQRAA